ncbi:hypothetical protein NX059_005516 [Plenodomus lindquistii]|nr:hypothetical protein NX059_005516 [Plenodomus lindquistii]
MPTTTLTVIYPTDPDANYDIAYYKTKHMPLSLELWGAYGMKSFTVTTYGPGLDGSPPPYAFSATSVWESKEAIGQALAGPGMQKVTADAQNFTTKSDKMPVFLVGEME